MINIVSTLKAGGKAAVAALMVGAMILPVAPTQAAEIQLNFGISGGGNGFSFHIGKGGKKFRGDCASVNEIRRSLRRNFHDLDFIRANGWRVVFEGEADWNDRDYRIIVNRCTGDYDLRRI
jgi:hypothetical protein